LDRAKNRVRIEELRIANEDSEDSKNVMLFRMVEILFGLFVGNSNGELRRTTTILSSPQNNRITTILTISLFRNNRWIHNCYFIPKTAAILLFLAHPNIP
jgi:hypothetical protein